VIVGYLLQIAAELKTAGSAEAAALRRRTSRLIRTLKPDTLRRLVQMGGDFTQRRQFVVDATDGMAVDSVLDILKAAAETSHESISHAMVRLLSKLAAHAETGGAAVRPQADAALRDQVRALLAGWTLPNPTPGAYGAALQGMARTAPSASSPGRANGQALEPDRVVAVALEVGVAGPRLTTAVDAVARGGRLTQLLDALNGAPASEAAEVVRRHVATADMVAWLVAGEPLDFSTLERLVAHTGPAAAPPLLDRLALAEARGTRRGLLALLAKMGAAIAPFVIARLEDPRWYVTRNLLALLEDLGPLPEGYSAAAYLRHPDARVRWQAVKLQFKQPADRTAALTAGLSDPDPRTLRLALGVAVATQTCPEEAVPVLASRASDRTVTADVRVLAARVLGYCTAETALQALLRLTSAGRTLFGREKLPPKSPELLVALTVLATSWRHDSRARAQLARAAAASDREIRAAAAPEAAPT
jgi:hypothetical protein